MDKSKKTERKKKIEFEAQLAGVIGKIIAHFQKLLENYEENEALSFLQMYSLKQGIKKFSDKGCKAVHKEIGQLHKKKVFCLIHVKDMTEQERKQAMESLIFLNEKGDKSINART